MSRSTSSASWSPVPDSMQSSFTHDPLSTNSQSRLTSDPSNYQLSSLINPSQARRVQGLPDPYNIPDSPDKKQLALPDYVKRMRTYGTRKNKTNADGKVPTGAATVAFCGINTDIGGHGETIVVGVTETSSVERDIASADPVSDANAVFHVLDEVSIPSVREQESRATSHSVERQSWAEDVPASTLVASEEEFVSNGVEGDALGNIPLNDGQVPDEASLKDTSRDPGLNGIDAGDAPEGNQLLEGDNEAATGNDLDKGLGEEAPLGEETIEDVPVATNPQNNQKKRQVKYWTTQKKHIIDAIIGHRLGAQQKPDFLVKWKGYTETTWEPGSILREDVPWLLIDYLEVNIVYGDISNTEYKESSPKRQKITQSVTSNGGKGRGSMRKTPSQTVIVMEDVPPTVPRKTRGRPPKVHAAATNDDGLTRRISLRSRSNSQREVPTEVPTEVPQPPAPAAKPEIEPEIESEEAQAHVQVQVQTQAQAPSPLPVLLPLPLPVPTISAAQLASPEPRLEPPRELLLLQFPAALTPHTSPAKRLRAHSRSPERNSPVAKQPISIPIPIQAPARVPSPYQPRLVAPIAPMGVGPYS